MSNVDLTGVAGLICQGTFDVLHLFQRYGTNWAYSRYQKGHWEAIDTVSETIVQNTVRLSVRTFIAVPVNRSADALPVCQSTVEDLFQSVEAALKVAMASSGATSDQRDLAAELLDLIASAKKEPKSEQQKHAETAIALAHTMMDQLWARIDHEFLPMLNAMRESPIVPVHPDALAMYAILMSVVVAESGLRQLNRQKYAEP